MPAKSSRKIQDVSTTETSLTPKVRAPHSRKKGGPNDVDAHVGSRLRERRSLMGFSQERLAESSGITFQQVQKYESGKNRISASRLYQFSNLLDVPVSYFFDQYTQQAPAQISGLSDTQQDAFSGQDILQRKETIELIRTYYAISEPKLRKEIMRLMKTMAGKD